MRPLVRLIEPDRLEACALGERGERQFEAQEGVVTGDERAQATGNLVLQHLDLERRVLDLGHITATRPEGRAPAVSALMNYVAHDPVL